MLLFLFETNWSENLAIILINKVVWNGQTTAHKGVRQLKEIILLSFSPSGRYKFQVTIHTVGD